MVGILDIVADHIDTGRSVGEQRVTLRSDEPPDAIYRLHRKTAGAGAFDAFPAAVAIKTKTADRLGMTSIFRCRCGIAWGRFCRVGTTTGGLCGHEGDAKCRMEGE